MIRPVPVLLHGYLGFSRFGPVQYFRGVAHALEQAGVHCLLPAVLPTGTIAERASMLASALFKSDIPEFFLLGHSMGGLDARYLASFLDSDRRIKRVLTVSTPHYGSPVATWALASPALFPAFIRSIGRPGLDELTPEARLAAPIPDRDDVLYTSYASSRPLAEQSILLRSLGYFIPGDNDGLVSVDSARWGSFRGTLRADHLELIGWSLGLPDTSIARPFDHIQFWVQAAKG